MKKSIYHIFAILQLFADAGTLVNATGNYVNAYTGETQAFDGTNSLSGELKVFYDTELLENARVEMFYAQFAKKQTLPANHGTTVEWRKWNTFAKAGQLVEGVIPTGQKFGMSSKTGAINQYGTYAAISDKLELRAYDDTILGATEEMGASAAETQETLIRDGLLVNTNVLYCDNINLADGSVVGTPTACNQMEASATVLSMFTPDMVAKGVTIMKKNRVPTIGGNAYINSGLLYYDAAGVPVYGLEIGQRNEIDGVEVFNKYARFTSDKLAFYDQNGNEVAYISDRKLYITHVQITGSLLQGGFKKLSLANGGTVTKWVGTGG